MKSFRPCNYDLNHGPLDPVSGSTMALVDLFYDVFKGIGEIGSEFVRIPSVGQSESSKTREAVQYPARAEVSLNADDRVVGARAAKGIARMTKATVRSPMTMTVAMAQGAHNLPKMYGDKTVRPQDKITGVGSGLLAGTKVSGLFGMTRSFSGFTPFFFSLSFFWTISLLLFKISYLSMKVAVIDRLLMILSTNLGTHPPNI